MSYKAKLLSHAAVMIDMTIEERCKYCQEKLGYHYSVVHTAIFNETGFKL